MVVGGIVAATGITLVILNRPRQVLDTKRQNNRPQVVPAVTRNGVGLTIAGRF